MPIVKIHVLEGQYDDARLGKVSSAVPLAASQRRTLPSEQPAA